jgi:hypothetical protein
VEKGQAQDQEKLINVNKALKHIKATFTMSLWWHRDLKLCITDPMHCAS